MPHLTYLLFLLVIFKVTLLVDLTVTKIILHRTSKLVISLLFISTIFFLIDSLAISWQLWDFSGEGITNIYLLGLPLEEILFVLITPYSAIVLWELFHLRIKRR